jgi:nucleoside-diphosphate-sugar epimerase
MKVLVTGGTGFVGSHTVAALRRDGHDVRILARSSQKAGQVLASHGVDAEVVVGDMTDARAVGAAVDGCDALVHAAAEVAVASGDAVQRRGSASGTDLVLNAAVTAGLDPIIYTSSVAVHLPSTDPVITTTSPFSAALSSYGASKLEAERLVGDLVSQGHPVTTFVIGGVYGPVCPHLENSFEAVLAALEGLMITPPGGCTVIDVRDLAHLIGRAVSPGMGPRRYMAGGTYVSWVQWVEALERAAGVPVTSQAVTREELLALGRECDALRAAGEPSLPLSEEAAIIMCSGVPTDDAPTLTALGFGYRPLHDTLADTVTYLRAIGRLPAPAR